MAGAAFAVAGSGLHHKICHALGGAFDLPHAATHAIVLPHVLAFNASARTRGGGAVGRALGADDPVAGLRELARPARDPGAGCRLGDDRGQVGEAVAAVEPPVPADNPRRSTGTAER